MVGEIAVRRNLGFDTDRVIEKIDDSSNYIRGCYTTLRSHRVSSCT